MPKIDWQINNNNLFSATYNRLRWESPAGIQTQAINTLGRSSFGDDFVNVDSLNVRLQSTLSANYAERSAFSILDAILNFKSVKLRLPGEPTTATTSSGSAFAERQFIDATDLAFGTPTFLERGKFPGRTSHSVCRHGYDDQRTTHFQIRRRHQPRYRRHCKICASKPVHFLTATINDFIIDYMNF
ncbi:MAG: hypothetical protein WKF71_11785 [Pyrinomonadaceae bacterium]